MKNCIKKQYKTQGFSDARPTFWLHFLVYGNGVEWMDAGLPTPNYFYRLENHRGTVMNKYGLAYLIDGFFLTKNSYEYLNDIVARFCLTLPIKERLKYPPRVEDMQHDRVRKLREFQNLQSLTKQYVPKLRGDMPQDNNKFWELKLWIEHRIRDNGGEGNFVPFEPFFEYAYEMYDWQDRSTAKSKCRNIWSWYYNRGWKYHMLQSPRKTKKEIYMTRRERALSNAKAREERTYKAVANLATGMFADEYRKKSGSWHIGKIAKAIGLSEKTVSKHLKRLSSDT